MRGGAVMELGGGGGTTFLGGNRMFCIEREQD
jgi:hypothetical protein